MWPRFPTRALPLSHTHYSECHDLIFERYSDLALGSSRGRGNRAAAWFADYLIERNDTDMQSLGLVGGIKAWAAEGGEYVQHMQEYDASKWEQ